MNYERRPDVIFYDTENNSQFCEALVDSIVIPAYFRAVHLSTPAQAEKGAITAECEQYYEGNQIVYDFQTEKDSGYFRISSMLLSVVDDLTREGAVLIHDEVQTSTLPDDVKERFRGEVDDIHRKGEVSVFTKRVFHVLLQDNVNSVHVVTTLGYSINGHEVIQQTTDEDTFFELEAQKQTTFERDDIVEIVRALLAMDLIEEADVKQFLDQEF